MRHRDISEGSEVRIQDITEGIQLLSRIHAVGLNSLIGRERFLLEYFKEKRGYFQLHCSWELAREFSPKVGATKLDFGERWRFYGGETLGEADQAGVLE